MAFESIIQVWKRFVIRFLHRYFFISLRFLLFNIVPHMGTLYSWLVISTFFMGSAEVVEIKIVAMGKKSPIMKRSLVRLKFRLPKHRENFKNRSAWMPYQKISFIRQ